MQVCRPWDPPAQNDALIRVPPSAVAQLLSEAPQASLIELVGHWANFDCVVDVPDTWTDLTTRLVATIGGIDYVVATKRIDAVANPLTSGARIGGLLFAVRGVPADRYRVEAWRTAVNHAPGKIYAYAWGSESAPGAEVMSSSGLGLSPDKVRSFTTGTGGLVASPTTAFTANPSPRGRVAVTGMVWTRGPSANPAGLLTLRETPSGVVRAVWVAGTQDPGVGQEISQYWPVEAPLWSAPSQGWELVRSTAFATDYIVNLSGYDS